MTRSAHFLFSLSALTCLTLLARATAQDPAVPVGGLQIAQLSGTLQAMALNKLKITTEDKKEYFATVTDRTTLDYKGTAETDFLLPGLLVRFTADVSQTGVVQSPLKELEVFTYSQQQRMSPEQQREQTAGIYQLGGEVGNLKKPATKASKAATPTAGATSSQSFRVVGQLVGGQAGKMFVQAGATRVQFEIEPKAKITVTSRDTTFCQIGDQVKVSGLRTAGQEQFIQCERVEVVGAKPLGPADGKAAKIAKPSKGAKGKDKNGKAGADKADPKDPDAKKIEPKN